MGGVIVRCLVSKQRASPIVPLFHTLLTLNSPHCGLLYNQRAANWGKRFSECAKYDWRSIAVYRGTTYQSDWVTNEKISEARSKKRFKRSIAVVGSWCIFRVTCWSQKLYRRMHVDVVSLVASSISSMALNWVCYGAMALMRENSLFSLQIQISTVVFIDCIVVSMWRNIGKSQRLLWIEGTFCFQKVISEKSLSFEALLLGFLQNLFRVTRICSAIEKYTDEKLKSFKVLQESRCFSGGSNRAHYNSWRFVTLLRLGIRSFINSVGTRRSPISDTYCWWDHTKISMSLTILL